MFKKATYSLILLVSILLFSSSSCDRKKFRFPYVPVNLSLGLDSDLAGLGVDQTKILPGYGLKGIIIYRSDVDEFHAFDMACTFEEDFSCTVAEDTSFNGIMKCPCCSSRFLLMQGGDPFDGPASWPLVEYTTYVNGRFLVIKN